MNSTFTNPPSILNPNRSLLVYCNSDIEDRKRVNRDGPTREGGGWVGVGFAIPVLSNTGLPSLFDSLGNMIIS